MRVTAILSQDELINELKEHFLHKYNMHVQAPDDGPAIAVSDDGVAVLLWCEVHAGSFGRAAGIFDAARHDDPRAALDAAGLPPAPANPPQRRSLEDLDALVSGQTPPAERQPRVAPDEVRVSGTAIHLGEPDPGAVLKAEPDAPVGTLRYTALKPLRGDSTSTRLARQSMAATIPGSTDEFNALKRVLAAMEQDRIEQGAGEVADNTSVDEFARMADERHRMERDLRKRWSRENGLTEGGTGNVTTPSTADILRQGGHVADEAAEIYVTEWDGGES